MRPSRERLPAWLGWEGRAGRDHRWLCALCHRSHLSSTLLHPHSTPPHHPQLPPSTDSCEKGCTCEPKGLPGSVPYDQIVLFLEEVHPTPSKRCRVAVTMDGATSPAGSKVRVSGVIATADPGHIAGRVGEEKYMSWLSGEQWVA